MALLFFISLIPLTLVFTIATYIVTRKNFIGNFFIIYTLFLIIFVIGFKINLLKNNKDLFVNYVVYSATVFMTIYIVINAVQNGLKKNKKK